MKVLGIDFDGLIHDSLTVCAHESTMTHKEFGVDIEITPDFLRATSAPDVKGVELPTNVDSDALWLRYLERLTQTELGPMIQHADTFLAQALKRYDKVVVISGCPKENIVKFLDKHQLPQLEVVSVIGSKTLAIIAQKVTTYSGDMVQDGIDSLAANARFIAVLHEQAFTQADALLEFKNKNPGKPIFLANDLQDAIKYFE